MYWGHKEGNLAQSDVYDLSDNEYFDTISLLSEE